MKPFVPEKLPLRTLKWDRLIPFLGKANRALATYGGVLSAMPNAELLLSPLTTQEAVLSSRIEGTQATLGDVLKYEAGEVPVEESKKQDIQEIRNYRYALRYAERALANGSSRPFNLNLLLELHSILLNSVRGKNKGRGRFRDGQNWIGTPGCTMEAASFVPPEQVMLSGLLDNWEKYYHEERPDPLGQLAIIHAQFEIIHPFWDGNGRLGRILIPLFLYEKNLIIRPMFYLSSYMEEHKDEYINRLRALGQEGDAWNQWVEFFLIAIEKQSVRNINKAKQILDFYERMKIQFLELTHSQYAVPLLDEMFSHPVFKSTDLEFNVESRPSRQAVAGLLRTLREAGVLTILREGSGRRAQIFAFKELINICEGTEVL